MNNKVLLCNTGSYTLYLIITYNGKEYVKEYIYIYIYIYIYTHICVYHFAIHQKPTQHCQSTIIQQQQQQKTKIQSCSLFSSVTQSCLTLCDPMYCSTPASLSITNSWSLPKLISIESVIPSGHLILCHPFLLPPSIFPSIRVFSKESVLRIRWPKYWSFSFSISPSKEYSGLISFRMDWLDLLAVQGTLKSPIPQFKSINFSALSFLYTPTLTSIHDYWKNQSLD